MGTSSAQTKPILPRDSFNPVQAYQNLRGWDNKTYSEMKQWWEGMNSTQKTIALGWFNMMVVNFRESDDSKKQMLSDISGELGNKLFVDFFKKNKEALYTVAQTNDIINASEQMKPSKYREKAMLEVLLTAAKREYDKANEAYKDAYLENAASGRYGALFSYPREKLDAIEYFISTLDMSMKDIPLLTWYKEIQSKVAEGKLDESYGSGSNLYFQ